MHDLLAAHLISINTLGGSSEQKGKKCFCHQKWKRLVYFGMNLNRYELAIIFYHQYLLGRG